MRRLILVLSVAQAAGAQSPVVSTLHTVSIHVDSIETYNALFHLLSAAFQWPVVYGKPLSAGQKDRRNCAGIWAGNLRLEICGPYPKEFELQEAPARLHGLTFRPRETAQNSAEELDRRSIRRRPVATWGTPDSPLGFVVFDDREINAPLFSVSIMESVKRQGELTGHHRAHRTLTENRGGPLRLKRVRELRVFWPDRAALEKWRRLFDIEGESWSGGGGPALRFVPGAKLGIEAAVLEVESPDESARVLRGLGLPAVRNKEWVECDAHCVRLLLAKETGVR